MINNSGIESIASGAAPQVLGAIQKASAKTGVDFAYLVQQAKAESSFNPSAKAKTSSATGLFQFLKSTWLDMIDKHGEKHGINPHQSKSKLLNLRKDPEVASVMAAEFAKDNEGVLKRNWGGDVGQTELYFAHFLGAGGAAAFLNAHDRNPAQKAAIFFPDAARSNQNVFYDVKTGRAKTLDEVYHHFDRKFKIEDISPHAEAEIQVAAVKPQSVVWADNGQSEVITWNQRAPIRNPVAPIHYIANPLDLLLLAQTEMHERTLNT